MYIKTRRITKKQIIGCLNGLSSDASMPKGKNCGCGIKNQGRTVKKTPADPDPDPENNEIHAKMPPRSHNPPGRRIVIRECRIAPIWFSIICGLEEFLLLYAVK